MSKKLIDLAQALIADERKKNAAIEITENVLMAARQCETNLREVKWAIVDMTLYRVNEATRDKGIERLCRSFTQADTSRLFIRNAMKELLDLGQ